MTENKEGPYLHKKSRHFYTNNGILSGSSISMAKSFKNLIQKVDLTIKQSVKMCCATPHKVISGQRLDFKIEIGKKAKFNIMDKKFDLIKAVY